ncbi:MAG: hypothetical protein COB76_02280 [Alphaproteobacteria bacterium]|nr:MAG: hypothetical protein COB76_02280 [Alphaproteobacteria bacterium]
MIKFLNEKTQKMSAALMTGAMVGTFGDIGDAAAKGVKEYSEALSDKVAPATEIVAFMSYMGGFVLSALGIVGLKNHVENPSQHPMKNGLAKLGFGGILLALPPLVEAMQGTGDTGSSEIQMKAFGAGGITGG